MKKGFTLIEVIAAIAIFAIGIVGISLAFSTAITMRQGNDIRQNNSEFSDTIIERYKTSYDSINTNYTGIGTNVVSSFIYFNNMGDLEGTSGAELMGITKPISGNVDKTLYPISSGNKYGALISVTKEAIGDVSTYHIYTRVWTLGKSSKYQSIKDFYESR